MKKAVFIGRHTADQIARLELPIEAGDATDIATEYAFSPIGGNAVTSCFCAAKLGARTVLLSTVGRDYFGRMLSEKASEQQYDIELLARHIPHTPLSLFIPNGKFRRKFRLRKQEEGELPSEFPQLHIDPETTGILHIDGHQPDACAFYVKLCRERGVLVSLDGGSLRQNTEELLSLADINVVSMELCEDMGKDADSMIDYLWSLKNCRVGAVTMGDQGMLWFEKPAMPSKRIHAHKMDRIVDTTGCGDITHGAMIYHFLAHPEAGWGAHLRFGNAAGALATQFMGNEDSLPTLANIEALLGHRPQLVATA